MYTQFFSATKRKHTLNTVCICKTEIEKTRKEGKEIIKNKNGNNSKENNKIDE